MKKTVLAAAALLMAMTASAEGYQINTLSAKQLGMGHTGVAMKLGGESMFFNPAGMAYMNKTLDLSGSITALMPSVTATVDGKEYQTDNGVSTPLNFNAAFSIYDNLKAGISFYTPYGSAINWTDNWPGAVLSQNVSLKTFTVQPTVAWAINEKFSVGLGAMISWGNVDLNKGLVSAETADKAIGLLKQLGQVPAETPAFGNTTPASVNLRGNAAVVVGFNIGAMYNVNDNLSFGASFRSKMKMKVKSGDAYVNYANLLAENVLDESLGILNEANFKAMMPAPWVLSLGTCYKPIDKLTLAFDARLTGWKAYDKLNIEFLSEQLTPYNQNITKNYKNSWCFSLGGQYAVTDRFDARLGLMIDTSPVNKNFYNPETPGMTKIEPTLGLSFRPIPRLSIDLAFMYIHGCGAKNVNCEYEDLLGKMLPAKIAGQLTPSMGAEAAAQTAAALAAQAGLQPTGNLKADYRLHAFAPAIGISYSF